MALACQLHTNSCIHEDYCHTDGPGAPVGESEVDQDIESLMHQRRGVRSVMIALGRGREQSKDSDVTLATIPSI